MDDEFDALINAQLDGKTVRYADMVRMDFLSGEMRLFQGHGLMIDGTGEQWKGIGRAGRITSVSAGPSGAAEEMTLSLFGDSRIMTSFRADNSDAVGRQCTRYIQFFDVRQFNELGEWVDWQPLGVPLTLFRGTMGPLLASRSPIPDPVDPDAASRVLTCRVINSFVNRRRPPYSFFSYRDQLARTGGTDNIFINVSRMANATATWPVGLT